jgi:hypothetical protein
MTLLDKIIYARPTNILMLKAEVTVRMLVWFFSIWYFGLAVSPGEVVRVVRVVRQFWFTSPGNALLE